MSKMFFAVTMMSTLGCGGCGTSAVVADAGPDAGGGLGFTPSNVDLGGIDLSKVGDFVVAGDCTIDTDANLASCGDGASVLAFKLAKQSDGTQVAVYVARSMNIPNGNTLTVTGSHPFVFVAMGTIAIDGSLNANGHFDVGTAGGAQAQQTNFTHGIGTGGGAAGPVTAGGGGASYCGLGGLGGVESNVASPATPAFGTPAIVPLVAGSSGGSGSGFSGSGGGAIQLVAGTSITVGASGAIQTGGGGGSFGGISGQEANGGGSGGSILLESLVVTISGTLASNGGGGGAGSSNGIPGGADATPNATPAPGGNQGAGPSAGGDGSGGAVVNGTAGSFTAGNSAGGGGGGAGRIRINTKSGAATLTTATLSPAASTPCATQGTVAP